MNELSDKNKKIKKLVESITVGSTYDKNHLIEKDNFSSKDPNKYGFMFVGVEYLLIDDRVVKYYKDQDGNETNTTLQDFWVDQLIKKLEVATTFKNDVGATEPTFLFKWDPSGGVVTGGTGGEGKSFWRFVLDYMKVDEERAKEKDKESVKKSHYYNLRNMANNFDPSIAPDLTEEEKNYIISLSGINKYNVMELKTFEIFDFDNDKDDIVNLWLEDNNFHEEMGRWSTDSTYTVSIPDYMISDKGYLKVSFGAVGGNFEIDGGKLVSLKGCPTKVGGDFEVINNYIEDLRYLPEKIDGGLYLYNNKLKSLQGLSNSIIGTYINVSKNQLTDLNGCPYLIHGTFKCKDNKLTSLQGGPGEVKGSFDASNNDISTLDGAPKKVSGEVKLENAGPIPETELAFYKEVGKYDDYYGDLLHWIINNDRLEKDLDAIDWPEGFLRSKGNIIRSVKGINKYNLGLKIGKQEESLKDFSAFNESIDIIEVGKTYPHITDTETQGGLYYELSDEMCKELGIEKVKESDKALISEIHFDTRNVIVEMFGEDEDGEIYPYDEVYKEYHKSDYTFKADDLPEDVKMMIKENIERDIRSHKSGKIIKKYNL